MRKSITKLVFLAILMVSSAVNAEVVIELHNPDSFLDMKFADLSPARGQEQFISSIKKELSGLAEKALGENQNLQITFENVDLAGRIEPMRGRQNVEVRVVNSMDPIRLKFSYRLSDAENVVIKEGTEDLRDFVRQTDMYGRNRYKSLNFERRMMRNWFRQKFSID